MRGTDEEAFASFVHARSAALHATAWALTRDRQLAEDLVQSALARCYLAWPKIHAEDPEGYVRKAMINAQRNVWRRRLPSLSWRAEVPDDNAVDNFDDQVVDRKALLDAVASLSPQQRVVVVYRYYEDQSDEQIAQLLECSLGTVKRQGARALRRLRANAGVQEMSAHGLRSRTVS